MLAYCLNMEGATERWLFTQGQFDRLGMTLVRVEAVVGKRLAFPIPEFDKRAYQRWHGKQMIAAEVGCYLSHLRAMTMFLETNEEVALICEDDVKPAADLKSVLAKAVQSCQDWDILRLSGFHDAKPKSILQLDENYSLCVNLKYLAGSGAYVINRKAASTLIQRLLPMSLPYDHALDREWLWGLRSLCIHPLPIDQAGLEFNTQIDTARSKIAWYRRYWTVLPFRATTQLMRFLHRSRQWLGHRWRSSSNSLPISPVPRAVATRSRYPSTTKVTP